jgi:hypothetical protein
MERWVVGNEPDWAPLDHGLTLGTRSSEEGVIVLDDEHPLGARITLERDTRIAPFAITCGIYGLMCHTRFFGDRDEAEAEYATMRRELVRIMSAPSNADPDAELVRLSDDVARFVGLFP